ncbi:hypothetical protein MMC27_002746 [Xylographa pallens]|nr:hypothetical protein [Xylographa pallens]
MTIPRRLVLEPPVALFNYDLAETIGFFKGLFSLCVAGPIIIIDTAVWVFIIMVGTGPFIFSGLVEAVLDYRIVSHLHDGKSPGRLADRSIGLSTKDRIQLLTTVVAGNLETEGVRVNPQEELDSVLDREDIDKTVVHLRAMLDCQYSFGATVGAPILLYIGSFIYTILDLHNLIGDADTARALAFGIWWMCIVHVAAVSGGLLASNNPSTAAAIVGKGKQEVSYKERIALANTCHAMEDRCQARIEAFSRLSLTYRARYEPVWMWARGKSKARWLRHTRAWQEPWFRDIIQIGVIEWVFIIAASFGLVLIPCALAFWIEYTTPPIGLACRSLTILLYAVSQLIFINLAAWSHIIASWENENTKKGRWLHHFQKTWLGLLVTAIFLVPAWITATFTTVAGTLMAIIGIFNNCICGITIGYWFSPSKALVGLATDTESDRSSSWHWNRAGYTAVVFLACITYLGWWGQKFLREKFIQRVKDLVSIALSFFAVQVLVLERCPPAIAFT